MDQTKILIAVAGILVIAGVWLYSKMDERKAKSLDVERQKEKQDILLDDDDKTEDDDLDDEIVERTRENEPSLTNNSSEEEPLSHADEPASLSAQPAVFRAKAIESTSEKIPQWEQATLLAFNEEEKALRDVPFDEFVEWKITMNAGKNPIPTGIARHLNAELCALDTSLTIQVWFQGEDGGFYRPEQDKVFPRAVVITILLANKDEQIDSALASLIWQKMDQYAIETGSTLEASREPSNVVEEAQKISQFIQQYHHVISLKLISTAHSPVLTQELIRKTLFEIGFEPVNPNLWVYRNAADNATLIDVLWDPNNSTELCYRLYPCVASVAQGHLKQYFEISNHICGLFVMTLTDNQQRKIETPQIMCIEEVVLAFENKMKNYETPVGGTRALKLFGG